MKYLTYFEFRELWFKFWKEKNHDLRKSSSLVSKDESLLWINSGVAGLKDYFLGTKKPSNPRIVNIQKSVRTNDLTQIGLTNRHLTFFEMLGNFSIGDYFKKEALEWAWEFLTNEKLLNFDVEKIFITYFNEDKETFKILSELNIKKSHLIPMSKKTNFWDLGVGPCGPNVEFFYDTGIKNDLKNKGIKLIFDDIENDRYLEIWNVVFSQFVNLGNEKYKLLKNKNIDTGAGLERILFLLQEKENPFETDLFDNSLILLEKLLNQKIDFSKKENNSFNLKIKIILDHSRSIAFLISDLLADGIEINFKNKRGYVLRKIIRNACLKFYFLNIKKPTIYKISECVINKYSKIYKNLFSFKDEILELIKNEEKLFFDLLNNDVLKELLKIKNKFIKGKYIFDLVSSLGIPLEIIKNIANNNNLDLDLDSFDEFWEKHKKISNQKERKFVKDWKLLSLDHLKETLFLENFNESTSKVLGIFKNKKDVNNSIGEVWVIFDKTPFYAEKGGQSFDTGEIIKNNFSNNVIDVQWNNKKQILHKIILKTKLFVGDKVQLKINIKKRNLTEKNHSATHLLHSLLRNKISKKIKQNGSFNNEKYLRLDFFSPNKISKNEIINIEKEFNKIINKKIDSRIFWTSYEEAIKLGADAFFEKVYDKSNVRIVEFDGYSVELCGGTHVVNSSEIESFRITEFETISKNVYRIYAVTTNEKKDKLQEEYFKNLYILLLKQNEKILFLNNLEINKQLLEIKQKQETFIGYKEKFEIFKNLIIKKYKTKQLDKIKKLVINYKIPSSDIKIKNNYKIIIHKLPNNLKNREEFLMILFNHLKKENNIFICLINELKIGINNFILLDKTSNNINWIKVLKDKYKLNISGGGSENKFRGLMKNIEINNIFNFILKLIN